MSPADGCSTHSRPTVGSDAPFLLIANTPQASRRHKKAAVAGGPKTSHTYCRASGCARRSPLPLNLCSYHNRPPPASGPLLDYRPIPPSKCQNGPLRQVAENGIIPSTPQRKPATGQSIKINKMTSAKLVASRGLAKSLKGSDCNAKYTTVGACGQEGQY